MLKSIFARVQMVIDEWEALTKGDAASILLERINNGDLPVEVVPLLQEGKVTAVVVRLIFAWYILGEPNGEPLSTLQIAQKLTALKIPTPEDLIPNRAKLKKRGFAHWSRGGVTNVLHKSSYRGWHDNFAYKTVNGRAIVNKNKEERISVPVPQIVPEKTWSLAQEKLSKGRSESTRGVKYEYLVGQRIRCECGYYMRSHTSHHSYTNREGMTKTYLHPRYRCPGRLASDDMANNTCTMPIISSRKIDGRVWQWIKEEIANPAILERKLREIQNGQRERMGSKQQAVDTLYAHEAEIEEELKRLGSLYAKQGMPSRIVDELIAQEGHKLELIEAEIRKAEQELVTPLTDEVVQNLLLFSMEFSEHLEATEATLEGRRTVIKGLDVTVEVFRKDGQIFLRCQSILSPKPREISLTVQRTP
jgi:recombinase/recombinase-like zinc beta ribbon protein